MVQVGLLAGAAVSAATLTGLVLSVVSMPQLLEKQRMLSNGIALVPGLSVSPGGRVELEGASATLSTPVVEAPRGVLRLQARGPLHVEAPRVRLEHRRVERDAYGEEETLGAALCTSPRVCVQGTSHGSLWRVDGASVLEMRAGAVAVPGNLSVDGYATFSGGAEMLPGDDTRTVAVHSAGSRRFLRTETLPVAVQARGALVDVEGTIRATEVLMRDLDPYANGTERAFSVREGLQRGFAAAARCDWLRKHPAITGDFEKGYLAEAGRVTAKAEREIAARRAQAMTGLNRAVAANMDRLRGTVDGFNDTLGTVRADVEAQATLLRQLLGPDAQWAQRTLARTEALERRLHSVEQYVNGTTGFVHAKTLRAEDVTLAGGLRVGQAIAHLNQSMTKEVGELSDTLAHTQAALHKYAALDSRLRPLAGNVSAALDTAANANATLEDLKQAVHAFGTAAERAGERAHNETERIASALRLNRTLTTREEHFLARAKAALEAMRDSDGSVRADMVQARRLVVGELKVGGREVGPAVSRLARHVRAGESAVDTARQNVTELSLRHSHVRALSRKQHGAFEGLKDAMDRLHRKCRAEDELCDGIANETRRAREAATWVRGVLNATGDADFHALRVRKSLEVDGVDVRKRVRQARQACAQSNATCAAARSNYSNLTQVVSRRAADLSHFELTHADLARCINGSAVSLESGLLHAVRGAVSTYRTARDEHGLRVHDGSVKLDALSVDEGVRAGYVHATSLAVEGNASMHNLTIGGALDVAKGVVAGTAGASPLVLGPRARARLEAGTVADLLGLDGDAAGALTSVSADDMELSSSGLQLVLKETMLVTRSVRYRARSRPGATKDSDAPDTSGPGSTWKANENTPFGVMGDWGAEESSS